MRCMFVDTGYKMTWFYSGIASICSVILLILIPFVIFWVTRRASSLYKVSYQQSSKRLLWAAFGKHGLTWSDLQRQPKVVVVVVVVVVMVFLLFSFWCRLLIIHCKLFNAVSRVQTNISLQCCLNTRIVHYTVCWLWAHLVLPSSQVNPLCIKWLNLLLVMCGILQFSANIWLWFRNRKTGPWLLWNINGKS